MFLMDRDFSDELTYLMPAIPHQIVAANCSGHIVASVEDNHVELQCDTCGSVVGVVQVGIMEGLLGLDCEQTACPYCQRVNSFPGLGVAAAYVCRHCGRRVGM